MPKPWKKFDDYSQSSLRRLKRQRIADDDRSEGSSSPRDNPVQLGTTSEDLSLVLNKDTDDGCSALNVLPSPIAEDDDAASELSYVSPEEPTVDSDSDCYFNDNEDDDDDIDYEENFDPEPNSDDEPLYEGAPLTVAESLVSVLNLALRHKVTGALLSDILGLIALHCPANNKCKKTLYTFKKYFAEKQVFTEGIVRHFHCEQCYKKVENQDSICPSCDAATKIDYFIEVPIIPQIKTLYKRPEFYEMIQTRFDFERENVIDISDIYDGMVYKDLSKPNGFLSDRANISLTWYTDGIRIFKSSKFSIWPVYLIINELPYSMRTRKENVVLAAIWFGHEKPQPNLFLDPLKSSVRELRRGISVDIPNAEAPLIVKGMIVCGTCDLPAKALFLNMKQYNGKFGCQKCKQEGEYLHNERVLVYPYESFVLRTDEETVEHAGLAVNAGISVCGVKGPTVLSSLVHEKMRATAVDSMHCVYEGVVTSLMSYMFSPNFSDHPASLIQYVDLIDERIAALRPPSSMQRHPRSIAKHLAYWKAHERKAWLHYWSIPCTYDLMEEKYSNHYMLLVLGITLLNKSSISEHDLDIASRALTEFVSMFENLYHLPNMSNNLHQLLHLVENVRQFGPLWTTSCFPFEDLNGTLKSLVHGSNSAQLQIRSAASMFLVLASLNSEVLVEGTPAHSFCEKLGYKHGRMKRHLISGTTYIVGKCNKIVELPPSVTQVFEELNVHGTAYFQYRRLLKGKILFSCTEYSRSAKSDSSFASYSGENGSNEIGRIRCFIRVSYCPCRTYCNCNAHNYAILRPCVLQNKFSTCIDGNVLSSVHSIVELANSELAVDVQKLNSVCYYAKVKDSSERFVIEPVNLLEFE